MSTKENDIFYENLVEYNAELKAAVEKSNQSLRELSESLKKLDESLDMLKTNLSEALKIANEIKNGSTHSIKSDISYFGKDDHAS